MVSERKVQGFHASMALGIAAGIFGVFAGIMEILAGRDEPLQVWPPQPAGEYDPNLGVNLANLFFNEAAGFIAVVIALIGLVAALFLRANPRVAAVVMAVCGVAGFFAATLIWVVPGVLFLAAAVVAWRADQGREPVTA